MKEYHKIDGLWSRDAETKKLLPGVFRNPAVSYLQYADWRFTEKVDGTNIRVVWDGHKVSFYGRTDNANIPTPLIRKLEELFGGEVNEQVFEEHFGEKQVILYGEGYGAKIQKGGGLYRKDNGFILFDVEINGKMLEYDALDGIAQYFGIPVVPTVLIGTIYSGIGYVKSRPKSVISEEPKEMEGVVGKPMVDLMDASGKRVVVKIKVRDFEEMERYD